MQEGEGKDIRFNIDSLEVELKTTIGVESKGGIKFWIAELDGEYADKNEVVHTVRLTLDPVKMTESEEGEKNETKVQLSADE